MGKQFTSYLAEAYLELCQGSFAKGEAFSIVNCFPQKKPTWMFDKVLNNPLIIKSHTQKKTNRIRARKTKI